VPLVWLDKQAVDLYWRTKPHFGFSDAFASKEWKTTSSRYPDEPKGLMLLQAIRYFSRRLGQIRARAQIDQAPFGGLRRQRLINIRQEPEPGRDPWSLGTA